MIKQVFCSFCKEYNCSKHAPYKGLTQRLTTLLEYFESEPEEKDMRTYIAPDKNKSGKSLPVVGDFDCRDSRLDFRDDTLKHISAAEMVIPMPKTPSTAMIQVGHTGNANQEFIPSNNSTTSVSPTRLQQLTGGRYKSHERHHFIKIHASSFVSCSSPTGSYSELAIILWVDGKHYSKSSGDRYRVVLSMMYDAVDDLWSISSKLIKRGSYSYSKDEEEGQISNRLCLSSELRSEIKKLLLYLGISPRDAFKKFRRNMEENFLITSSEFGFTTVESASHAALIKDLEKIIPMSAMGWDSHRQHYSAHQYQQRHQTKGLSDDAKYANALAGYPGMSEDYWNSD